MTDVAHEFLLEDVGAGEHAPGDVALDVREPVLELIPPRRIG